MSCRDAGRLMSLRLDYQASAEEMRRLNDHMAQCGSCRRTWVSMQDACAIFGSKLMAQPGVDFTARVMERVRQMPAPMGSALARRAAIPVWLKGMIALMVLGVVFAACLVVIGGWLYFSGYLFSLSLFPTLGASILTGLADFGRDLGLSLWLAGASLFEAADKLTIVGVAVALLGMTLLWVHLVLAQGHRGGRTEAMGS